MPCGCVLLAYLGLSILDGAARTVSFEMDSWENASWGLHNFKRVSVVGEVAISADGSRRNTIEVRHFTHILIPAGGGKMSSLYLRPSNSGYTFDDEQRTGFGGECLCTWKLSLLGSDDARCTKSARSQIQGGIYMGEGQIAGRRVVRYLGRSEDGREDRIAYAPDLACEVFEEVHVLAGTFGIPATYSRYRVTFYEPGEPPGSRFRMPAGYTVDTRKP
ncbi:MAG: hypothetical protein QM757_11910 [Paludibaculum sp.]